MARKAKEPKEKVVNRKQGMGIQARMILGILPWVVIALIIMEVVLTSTSRSLITSQISETMEATLDTNVENVSAQMDGIRVAAEHLSYAVSTTYKTSDITAYAQLFQSVLSGNDLASGAGIWFEPNVYDPAQKYYGPYWYKDGNGGFVEDWEYSNAEYDYFNQEYYMNAVAIDHVEATVTNPYYDEASGTVMSTCSVPMYDGSKCLGCITVDLTLDTVQAQLENVELDYNGNLFLLDSSGVYIYDAYNPDAASSGLNIADDPTNIKNVAADVMGNERGVSTFAGGGGYNVYYATIPGVNWKLGITVSVEKINEPIDHMRMIGIVITIIALIICAVAVLLQSSGVAKAMIKVEKFAEDLADGNFTIKPVEINRKDEIGAMSDALNSMYENNSNVIRGIMQGSNKVNYSSGEIGGVATDLTSQFENVQSSMIRVNDAMANTGAATEQVSASANEVNQSVLQLAEETQAIEEEVKKIKERANGIVKESKEASENAVSVAQARGAALKEASKKAEVVSEIGTLAEAISDIADQINLLSLNASIEAARAGEHGRGFAVVASEINSLATDTKAAVDKIQDTISAIQDAFASLNRDSGELLSFVQDTVTPDYDHFIEVGEQYGRDAESFGNLTDKIAEMVQYIRESMEQVNAAVGSIAESATETATSSSEVTNIVNDVSGMVSNVYDMTQEQKEVSDSLSDIVSRFKMNEEDEG